MGAVGPKALLHLGRKPMLMWTIELFSQLEIVDQIVVAMARKYVGTTRGLIGSDMGSPEIKVVAGGKERQDSVYNGIMALNPDARLVLVHDAARPLVTADIVMRVIERAERSGAAIAAVPCADTVKETNQGDTVSRTLDRSRIWLAQTPQVFDHSLLRKAHECASKDGVIGTDDAFLVERLGHPVHVVMGSYENIKVTSPHDIAVAERILKQRIMEGRTK